MESSFTLSLLCKGKGRERKLPCHFGMKNVTNICQIINPYTEKGGYALLGWTRWRLAASTIDYQMNFPIL